MKKYIIISTALAMLSGCTTDREKSSVFDEKDNQSV